jgi:S1-C subfamily serine protease
MVTAIGDDIYGTAGVEREVYAIRGTVLPGNSGGPLLRPDGLVLGMVFGADRVAESTGYALAADELRDAVAAGFASSTPVDTGTCRLRQ